jgi:hypothetical protein
MAARTAVSIDDPEISRLSLRRKPQLVLVEPLIRNLAESCTRRTMLREQLFSLGVGRRLDCYLHGCPREYYGDPAGSAHAPQGRSAGIRSDSQPGPNLKVKSREFLKFEIAGSIPFEPAPSDPPVWATLDFSPGLLPEPVTPSAVAIAACCVSKPRYRVLACRLTAEQESTIRTLAETKCLRHLPRRAVTGTCALGSVLASNAGGW